MTAGRPRLGVTRLVARRAIPGGVLCGLVFGLAVASSVEQFTNLYDTAESRREIAGTLGGNGSLRALFGAGRALETVPGWVGWRSLGIVSLVGPIWGLLLATRRLRGEEDRGGWDMIVVGPTTRRRVTAEALAGLGLGLLALWAAAAAVSVAAGQAATPDLGLRQTLFLSTALVAPAGVFVAMGAFTSQLAPTRRSASQLAGAAYGAAFLLRALGNSDESLGWALWLTPLGWAQRLRPLTESSALPFLPLAALVAVLVAATVALAGARDVGSGVLAARTSSPPRTAGLGDPWGLVVRLERDTWLAWAAGLVAMAAFFGMVAAAAADSSSAALDDVLARLGARTSGLEAYLGTFFLVLGAALAMVAAGQATATRDEEAGGRAQTLLAQPVSRPGWLAGRAAVSAVVLTGMALLVGVAGWAGAASQGAMVSLGRMVAAGANTLPVALAVLGLGTLAHGLAPRHTAISAYGLVAWSLVVTLLGAAGGGNHVLAQLSLFEHVGLMPAGPFRPGGAAALLCLGAVGSVAGTVAFRRRDVVDA